MAKSGVIDWSCVDFEGESVDSLAAKLGVNPSSVSRARKRMGISPSAPRVVRDRTGVLAFALLQAQHAAERAGQRIPQSLDEARALAKQRETRRESLRRAKKRGCLGRVYFIAGGGYVKIGWTKRSVEERLEGLLNASPFPLHVVAVIEEMTPYDERRIHERFASLRAHREWFRFEAEVMAFLEEGGGPQKIRGAATQVARGSLFCTDLRSKEPGH